MKFSKLLARVLALVLMVCMTMQMLPLQTLAAENRTAQMDKEIEALREEVADREKQLEELLGYSLEEVYKTHGDGIMPAATDDVTEVTDESAFTFDAETGTIEDFTAPSGRYAVIIPSTIGGVEVKALGASVFYNQSRMISVTIPSTVTSIGNNAFYGCSALETVTMHCSLTEIPYRAFYNCSSLKNMQLPDGLKTIGQEAFYGTRGLTGITELPKTVTSIGYQAFYCGQYYDSGVRFTKLDLTNVETVGGYAFAKIPSLEEVILPADISQYNTYIFSGCTALTSVTFAEGATATGIPNGTFSGCSALAECTLPATVTSIGQYAFNKCAALASIDIANVTQIGAEAFKGCSALRSVTLNEYVELDTGVFSETGLVNITMPDGITELPNGTFENCTELVSVTAKNLEKIGSSAFEGCTSLTAPPNMTKVTNIGAYAFARCLGLTQLDLYAVSTDLILGAAIVEGCTNLEKITLHGDYVGKALSSGNIYDAPFSFAPENVIFEFDGNPTAVGTGLFKDAPFVKDLSILPASVTEFYEFAFSGTPLTEITIPEHITKVRAGCFANCASLVKVTVLNPRSAWMTLYAYDDQTGYGNQSVNKMGFFAKTYLADHKVADDKTDITFSHESWTEIPHGFFAGSYIRDTEFLANMPYLEILEPYSFYYCSKLENLVIPEGITTINHRAFMESLEKVKVLTIPASVTSLAENKSTSSSSKYTQHFYEEYSCGLTDVYIYNPSLELYADDFDYKANYKYIRRVFGTYSYYDEHPLTIHGVVDSEGNSTAKDLCDASGGKYVFVPMGALGKLSLTVMAGETDITDQVSIEWKNSEGLVQGAGPELQPHAVGVEYTYTITLPEELLDDYYIPETGTLTSTEGGQALTLELEPIPTATFTVKAPEGAEVEMTQKVNGIELTDEGTVGSSGSVTFDAKQVYTEIAVSLDDCYSRYAVISEPEESNTVDLTEGWKKLPATSVIISATSELDGVESYVADLSDFTFTVKNGSTHIPTTVQGNMLYLDGSETDAAAADLLTLEVSVNAVSDLIAPAPIEFRFEDGAVNVPFKSRGHISMNVSNYSPNDPEGYYLWIFDTDDQLVDSYTMYYGFAETDPLPEGGYTVVAIDMSVGISSVPDLSALKTFGLTANFHYYQQNVGVVDGHVTELGEVEVPDYAIFGGNLYVDMFESVALDSMVAEPSVGQSFFLWMDYKLKSTYSSTNDKQIMVQLPKGTVLNQVYTPEGTGSYTYDTKTALLTVFTKVNEGQIYLSVKATDADRRASVVASAKIGAYTAKPLSFELPIHDLRIEAQDVKNGEILDRTISVYTQPNAKVSLYVNGEGYRYSGNGVDYDTLYEDTPYGRDVTADGNGKATFTHVRLPGPASADKTWTLTAKAEIPDDVDHNGVLIVESEEQKIICYSPDPFNVVVQIPTYPPYNINGKIIYNDYDSKHNHQGVVNGFIPVWFWTASVAPGMGKYIDKFYLKFRGGSIVSYLELNRMGADLFGAEDMEDRNYWMSYLDYYFTVTDEYYTEYLGQPVPMDTEPESAAAERSANIQELITEFMAFEDEYADVDFASLEAQAKTDAERTAILELKATLGKASMEASNLLGMDVRDASDDEIFEAMGITTRQITDSELRAYADNAAYTKIETDGVVTHYAYADASIAVVVDIETKTVTEYDYTKMVQGGRQSFKLKDTKSTDEMLQQAKQLSDKASQIVQTVQFAIDNIANVGERLGMSAGKIGSLAKLGNEALGQALVVFNFYQWGSMWSEVYRITDIQAALSKERASVAENDEDYADALGCMRAISALWQAYNDLMMALLHKIASLSLQLLFTLLCLATSIGSFGFSLVINLLVFLAGYTVDQTLDENIERARQFINMRQKEKAFACRPYKDEDEDDADCNPIYDPSGYVYEGVFSNRVEGETVTIYKNSDNGEPWDAEEFGQQNPLTTDNIGYFRWDVPVGQWKVVVSESEDYYRADTTDIYKQDHMREGRDDITEDGWHMVLPIQTEVHIPVVSKHAPVVDEANTIAYSDGILVQFSQYMKEETLEDQITVTMGGQTFTGDQLKIEWPDRELSDHYYDRTFASQMMISRADGQTWIDEVTVSIAGGENYAGTAFVAWSKTLAVIPVIHEIRTDGTVFMEWDEIKDVTITLLDAGGNPIEGIPVALSTDGYAVFADNNSAEWTVANGVSDSKGQVTFSVKGKYPGNDTIVVSIPGRNEMKHIPVQIGSDAMRPVTEPVVTINGRDYSGQGHSVEVEEGTVITVTGEEGDTLYYSIGQNSCPCQDEQILIEDGQITVTESGYYKFAAYRDGRYSSRVHIDITVKAVEETTYPPTVAKPANGSVSISPAAPKAGDLVTITVSPDSGYITDGITVTEANGQIVTTTEVNSNVYTFIQPDGKVTITVTFKEIHTTCPGDDTCPMHSYTDLDTTSWYHDGVHFCIEQGLMQGVGKDRFNPNGTTTRAMIVTILWRLEGSPVVNSPMDFEDVSADQWYTDAIRWAAMEKIVEGYGNGKFGTNNAITREQMATIMYRYAKTKGYDVSVGEKTSILSYEDASDVAEWALPAMQWACGSGMIQGVASGGHINLKPQGNATRAQAAAILQRFIENVVKED